MNHRLTLALIAITLSGCGQHSSESMMATGPLSESKARGILSAMRPGADPALVEKMRQEAQLNANRQYQVQGNAPQRALIGLGRVLPKVSTDPISHKNDLVAPPAEQVSQTGAIITSAEKKVTDAVVAAATAIQQQPASYGGYYGTPPAPPGGGSLVPPPPAIQLQTQAQAFAGANPYANPNLNPYGIPVPQGWQGQPGAAGAAVAMAQPERPAGLFGSGRSSASSDDDSDNSSKKKADFVPITPTGMESRSAYKQKDDLKVLWKGAYTASVNLGELANEPKVLLQLAKMDLGLPNESSKGSFTVSQRQIDAIFKPAAIDKRVFPQVRKLQTELVQCYYRYLYAYNKYALAEQTVAARKQEVDYASSNSEKQRAATDLAQAQSDVEATKDDLHAAQCELANASSPAMARTIIGKVSGVTPSIESLAQSESDPIASAAGRLGKLNDVFGSIFHHHDKHEKSDMVAAATADEATKDKSAKDKTAKDKSLGAVVAEKSKVGSKDSKKNSGKAVASKGSSTKDLSPAPDGQKTASNDENKSGKATDSASSETPASTAATSGAGAGSASASASAASPSSPVTSNGPVRFVLKDVQVTARKSILTVAVKNNGTSAVNFDPDLISASEGSHKLTDASMRADFDSTSVDPNQEVKGTITIFGRPWSDRVAVYLSDNGKLIQLKR